MTRPLVALLVFASASPAMAQARRPAPAPPAAQPAVTAVASVHAGLGLFAAAESFEAVLGSRSGAMFGAGGEARWRGGLFAGARVSRFQESGTRVFVHQGEVFDLRIPSTVTIIPIEVVAGYRFVPRRGRLVPYAGGGVGWHRYEERGDFAGSGENVRDTFTGYHVLGGVEWRTSRLIGVAGEAQWTTVPDALGQHPDSVSAAFGEKDLGGAGFRVRVIIGR
jgi:opacity protein-like surface antigen